MGERDGSLRNLHQWGTAPTAAARALNQTEIGLHALTLTTTPCPSAAPLPNVIFTSPTLTPGTSPSQSQQSPGRITSQQSPGRITDRLPFPPTDGNIFQPRRDGNPAAPRQPSKPNPKTRRDGDKGVAWPSEERCRPFSCRGGEIGCSSIARDGLHDDRATPKTTATECMMPSSWPLPPLSPSTRQLAPASWNDLITDWPPVGNKTMLGSARSAASWTPTSPTRRTTREIIHVHLRTTARPSLRLLTARA